MSDEPEWFAARRYGYGAGLPISWQGWALTLSLVAVAIVTSVAFKENKLVLFAIMIPVTLAFILIAARTTRGGWRWRWGGED